MFDLVDQIDLNQSFKAIPETFKTRFELFNAIKLDVTQFFVINSHNMRIIEWPHQPVRTYSGPPTTSISVVLIVPNKQLITLCDDPETANEVTQWLFGRVIL